MDDEPLILDINVIGDMQAIQQMKALAQATRSIQPPLNAAADKTQRMSRNLQTALGPAQRLAKALTELRVAQGSGNPAAVFDAQYRAMQAQKAYKRAQGSMNPQSPSFVDKIKDVIMTSRVGGGGGLMPLAGKALGLLGPEIAVAAAGVKLLWEAAQAAAESLISFRQAMYTSGGTASETGRLKALGAATGVQDTAGLSRTLSDALKTSEGAAAGQRAGIRDYGGNLSGPVDKATNLLKLMDFIGDKNKTTDEEAIRIARALHVEELLIYRDVSDTMKQRIKIAAMENQLAHTSGAANAAADLNAEMGILQLKLDTLAVEAGPALIHFATSVIDELLTLGEVLGWLTKPIIALIDLSEKLSVSGLFKQFLDIFDSGSKNTQDHRDAVERNTDALNSNTAAALRNGTYGGGERARGAVPSSWGGANSRNWNQETHALGAM